MERDLLKAIRSNKGMTQKDVSISACISTPSYCLIENGRNNPSVSTAKAIASTLGFDWTRFYEDGIPDSSTDQAS